MFVLVFNQNNISNPTTNSQLTYRFPNSVVLKDKYIAVSSISLFYSWFNITTTAQTNTIVFTWDSGNPALSNITITIPDGLYEITEINNYFQFFCIQNGYYWIQTSSGNYIYPFEIILNPTRYAVQLNTFLIPTATPVGYSIPANFVGWPTVQQNPIIQFPSNFNVIVGYTAGFTSNNNLNNTYIPPVPSSKSQNFVSKNTIAPAGTLSYLSNLSPEVQPNSNVLFSISNINNPYSQPSSIIYSLSPSVTVGSQVYEVPPNFMWNKMIDGTYNEITLTLLGTDLRPLVINDPNMTILLTIKDKDEGMNK